ncbi:translin associated factor X isoform X2 [Lycorma delicatula]|uniref:translin associated factor X isoform X2 n=1 Tax=Lycorma delicatula TaxID=130591 RepID=UPI003F516EB4
MSGHGWNQRRHAGERKKQSKNSEEDKKSENFGDSLVIKAFLQYRDEMDKKHDKFERLVKISRDITIESKRIIFLLHSNVRGSAATTVLPEAKNRLMSLISTKFFKISEELAGEDPYQFSRSYYSGVQEFIEAYTFYHYLESGKLFLWEDAQNELIYSITEDVESNVNKNIDKEKTHDYDKSESDTEINECEFKKPKQDELKVLLTPLDYVLGVQDLTGELMRHCINSLSSGDVEAMYRACDFVRDIYTGLSWFKIPSRDFYRKLSVLRQSLLKIENACYMVRIRGSEIPKHILADVVTCQNSNHIDEDEGFY